ncbi:MAG TPA: copper chaperone PCu(A)C [Rhizobacter sp.]|nr:copper chaperone PCu(A)C [Rhizobacter sp.]
MNHSIDRRGLLNAGLALGASLVVPTARACEFFTINFTIIHPWTRASADEATSAIVNMKFENVQNTDRLIGAHTPVADGAEMGGEGAAGALVNFVIAEGQSSALSETGTYLRLVGLKFPLLVGRAYPLTLVFAKAGSVDTLLTVDYARFS